MAARLERDVERGSSGQGAGARQGFDLGVGTAEAAVVSEPGGLSVAHDHGADHRVGLDAPPAPRGLRERPTHPERVVVFHAEVLPRVVRVEGPAAAPASCGARPGWFSARSRGAATCRPFH